VRVALVACFVLTACQLGGRPRSQPTNMLDVRYRLAREGGRARPTAATTVYRATANLGTNCHMLPSDSRAFDLNARRCGATWAMVLGVSRLLVEQAGEPRFGGPPLRHEGRLRWVDLPSGCWPW
jgi:hypothetical protein